MKKIELIKRLKLEVEDEDMRRYLQKKLDSSSGLYLAKLFYDIYGKEEVEAFLDTGQEE